MNFDYLRHRLAGVVSIPVTAFDEDGSIDETAQARVVQRLVTGGIDVLTPNGNTGEFYALSDAETRRIVEITMQTGGDRITAVAGVGGSVPNAIASARHARDCGAAAIMVHQPVHPFLSRRGWVEYHSQIAASVPDLGVVTYVRNPALEGGDFAELQRLAPNFVAVKYAVADPMRFAAVKTSCDATDLVWIAGLAELSAPGYFAYGATGFTSGLVNVAPHISLGLLDALRAGDNAQAQRWWAQILPFEQLRADNQSELNVSVVKEAMAQLGVCRRDVRPPISVLTDDQRARVTASIATWNTPLVTGQSA
jgi:4-hydroxy-tetrahydrodipicolinate synthase